MSNRDGNGNGRSRRSILKSAAATGAIGMSPTAVGESSGGSLTKLTERKAVDPAAETEGRTVSIHARGKARYSFRVTGAVSAADAPDDTIENGTATAAISGEAHEFQFSGEFTEFAVDGDARVLVDGEPFDVDAFPHNSLTVVAPAGTEIDVSASGRLETTADSVSQPNPRRVHGTISGETTFTYAGELTYFDASERVKILHNDEAVSAQNVLPSRFPGELRISGARERAIVHTSHDARIEGDSIGNVDDGTITGAPGADDFVARYDGNVETIEHQSGATVEFRPENMRIVCTAPDDTAVEFGADASEALVHNNEYHPQVSTTVDAGDSEQIKYYGNLTTVSIAGLNVAFDDEADEDAIRSAKLQRAAVFERSDEYQTIAAAVNGRIRHDSKSIYYRSRAGEKSSEMIAFQTTHLQDGDRGFALFSRTNSSEDIKKASYEKHWLDDDRYVQKLEINMLKGQVVTTSDGKTFETKTFERGSQVPDIQQEKSDTDQVRLFNDPKEDQDEGQEDVSAEYHSNIPNVPSPSEIIDDLGDSLDTLSDEIGVAKDKSAKIISGAVENAEDKVTDAYDDIRVKGGTLLIDSQVVLIEIVEESKDYFGNNKYWKWFTRLDPGFADSAVKLAEVGVFDQLQKDKYGCAGCMATVALVISAGISLAAAAICIKMSALFLWGGAIACEVFFGELLDFIDNYSDFSEWMADSLCSPVC